MQTPFLLLKYVGKALLNVVGGGIAGDLLIEAVPEIAKAVWDSWSKDRDEQQRRAEMEAIVQAGVEQIREQVGEIKKDLAAGKSPEIELMLESYLTQVPAMVRKSLRRPSDPTGTTVSTDLVPKKAEDLLAFLPPKLPRFKRGDRPLVGVDWDLEELLGVGGFGEVWKARNPHMTSAPPVALKFCLDATAAKVLRNEAAMLDRVMRQGKHPGIVQLQHTYLSSEMPCLEYEYVEGGDLAGVIHEWHRSGEKPKPEQAAKMILQLAEIVGFAHRLNPPIVHRDLKPANILVQRQGAGEIALKIADFGIGGVAASQAIQLNRGGTSRGEFLATAVRGSYTPLYASPQQMRGEPPDPRDDVFALGVIWYQLLTGDLANGRPGGTRWHKRLLEQGMSSEMVDLMSSCFEDDPVDRLADAAKVSDKLGILLGISRSIATSESQVAISKSITTPLATAGKPATPQISGILRALLRTLKEHPHKLVCSFQDGIKNMKVGDAELIALALLPDIANLRELTVDGCLTKHVVGDDGVKALAVSPLLSNLEKLSLPSNPITVVGAAALAASSYLKNLSDLDLSNTYIGDAGLEALCSLNLFRLTKIKLCNFERLSHWTAIKGNKITEIGASALAASPHLTNLTELDLSNNNIGDAGAMALAASPNLAKLVKLNLSGDTSIGDAGLDALYGSFGDHLIYKRDSR